MSANAVKPWLRDEPPIVYTNLTLTELLTLWKGHRNDVVGQMAADEVCRRLCDGKQGH